MKVSVIIPTYNSEKYLKECLSSVINQTYKNLEIIIVDDKSIDNTIKIIKKIKDKRIKLIELEKNSGVAIARNKGIEISTGDYICFLDSDDYWYKEKIEKQLKFIKNKEFIYSEYLYLRKNKTHKAHVPKTITYKEALKNTTIFTSTVMLNMKYLNKQDIYMPNLKKGQDTACWWKILKKVNIAYGMQEVLSIYRVGNKSLSHNKIKAIKRTWNLYKQENIPLIKRIYYFMYYAFNATKRRIK
jgi:teichuronic acid biosynthesis glycosyltransferase TuaG